MGPAGPAVLGDVLVPCGADVVHSTDVPPVPGLGELRQVHELVRTRSRSVESQEDGLHEARFKQLRDTRHRWRPSGS